MKKRKIKNDNFCSLTIDIYSCFKKTVTKFKLGDCRKIFSYLKKLNSESIDLPGIEYGIKKIILDCNYGKRMIIIGDRILYRENSITEVLSDKDKIIMKLILIKINSAYLNETGLNSYLIRGNYHYNNSTKKTLFINYIPKFL